MALRGALLALSVNSTSLYSAAELVRNSVSICFLLLLTNSANPGHSYGTEVVRVRGSGRWEVQEHGTVSGESFRQSCGIERNKEWVHEEETKPTH